MKTKLLLQLADLLEKLPEGRFDYAVFVGEDWKGKADLSCGTTACALGWATTMPAIRKMGLRLVDGDLSLVPTKANGLTEVEIEEKDLTYSVSAASYIFDLSLNEAQYLFYPSQRLYDDQGILLDVPLSPRDGAKAKTVAKHIRNFVAWKQKYG